MATPSGCYFGLMRPIKFNQMSPFGHPIRALGQIRELNVFEWLCTCVIFYFRSPSAPHLSVETVVNPNRVLACVQQHDWIKQTIGFQGGQSGILSYDLHLWCYWFSYLEHIFKLALNRDRAEAVVNVIGFVLWVFVCQGLIKSALMVAFDDQFQGHWSHCKLMFS